MDTPAKLDLLCPKNLAHFRHSINQGESRDEEILRASYRYMPGEHSYRRYKHITRRQLELAKIAPKLLDNCTVDLQDQISRYQNAVEGFTLKSDDFYQDLLKLNRTLDKRNNLSGRVRNKQNRIANRRTGRTSYCPPIPDDVPMLMDNLVEFIQSDAPDPIAQNLVTHSQLVSIHPFLDGNGRTARAIMDIQNKFHGYSIFNPILFRWKGRYQDYRSSINAILRSTDIVVQHSFWEDAIAWSTKAYSSTKEEKSNQKSILSRKLLMARLSPLASEIARNVWDTPILLPEFVCSKYQAQLPEALMALDELVKLQVLKPKVLKLPQYTQTLFELEEKFAFYEFIDRELRERVN